ncbi:MAG: TlpA family protein disulfide reductase, partial [Halobacteriota archaeon]
MKRRDLLVGAAGAAAVAAGGVYALRPQSPDVVRSAEARRLYPREQASVTVPTSGEVTFVEFLASWCSICESMMPEVAEARRRVDDANFVGVTYEPVGTTVSEEDVVDWWTSNDGDWTLVH